MDLKEVVILDGIDILPDKSGFCIRGHDRYGQLPEIVLKDNDDRFQDKERLSIEAANLLAIVRLRDEMTGLFRRGKFLPTTIFDGRTLVGFKVVPKTWLTEGADSRAAYHEFHKQVVRW